MIRNITSRHVAFVHGLRLLVLASVMVIAPAASQSRHVPATQTPAAADDPFARGYVVTAQETHDQALSGLADRTTAHVDVHGRRLVIADLRAHQLADFSRHVHEKEHRCGGYFAFDTRAEAERFVRSQASARGITGQFLPSYTIDNQAVVNRWIGHVREANIRNTITHLSTAYPNRYFTSNHGRNAALWIRDHWRGLARGRSDISVELFTACSNCSTQPSVILTIQGNELADEIVVLGGHLDSISSSGSGDAMNAPGADDDASGIATLTEVLGVAMRNRYRPRRTIKFMAYAAEEVGLRGSRAIAQSFAAQGSNVVGVLQMDMTNFRSPASETDIRVMTDNSNAALVQFLRDLFATYMAPAGYTLGNSACGYACSDHASWTESGFPAAMYDEGPFFPLLHTPNDRLENMGGDAQHATIIARLGLAFLGELGKNTATPRERLMPPGGPPPMPGGPRRRP
jgi:leucyl aminopeptidase